jgi:hypothetical protein
MIIWYIYLAGKRGARGIVRRFWVVPNPEIGLNTCRVRVMVIQIKNHIVAILRPIESGRNCIGIVYFCRKFMQNYTYKLSKMAKLVFRRLLLLPAWRDCHVGQDDREGTNAARSFSRPSVVWRVLATCLSKTCICVTGRNIVRTRQT